MPKATKPTATTTTTAAKRRQSTVYDAVASRVNYAGFVKPRRGPQGCYRSAVARPADEVLSRRLRAPEDVSCVRRDWDEQVAAGLPDSVTRSSSPSRDWENKRLTQRGDEGISARDSPVRCRLLRRQRNGRRRLPQHGRDRADRYR